jgi:F-type H+-transporting ATPase subunit a
MIMGWIISIVIILGMRAMVGKPTLVPSKGQAVIESGINGVREIVEPIVGKRMFRPTFPLLAGFSFSF